MKIKIADLINIINTFNTNNLPGILPRTPPLTSTTSWAVISSGSLPVPRRFCGQTGKGYNSTKSLVDRCLTLDDPKHPGSKCSVAVGAVIDNQKVAPDAELPVILVIGVNYGQQSKRHDYVNVPVYITDRTNMRSRLNDVFALLLANACPVKAAALNGCFHLVAANFFPWITDRSWSAYKFNSVEESTLIHCCGHANPEVYIENLIGKIRPHTVVFHGANNAVPYLGGCVIRKIPAPIDFEVIFSDNLAPSGRLVSNAVKL
jgi:hypothetical protein